MTSSVPASEVVYLLSSDDDDDFYAQERDTGETSHSTSTEHREEDDLEKSTAKEEPMNSKTTLSTTMQAHNTLSEVIPLKNGELSVSNGFSGSPSVLAQLELSENAKDHIFDTQFQAARLDIDTKANESVNDKRTLSVTTGLETGDAETESSQISNQTPNPNKKLRLDSLYPKHTPKNSNKPQTSILHNSPSNTHGRISEVFTNGSKNYTTESSATDSAIVPSDINKITNTPQTTESIEVINISDDDEEEERYYSAGEKVVSTEATPKATKAQQEKLSDSDDDLMIIDEKVASANVHFKPTSFGEHNTLFNQPAPVPHALDPNFSAALINQNQLLQRYESYRNNLSGVVSNSSTVEQEISTFSLLMGKVNDAIRHLKSRLVQDIPQQLREQFEKSIFTKEIEFQKLRREVDHRKHILDGNRGRAQRLEYEMQSIRYQLSQNERSMNNPAPIISQNPYQPSGYASNVYSNPQQNPDQNDLQDLLDNIRPDEELEEGVELTPPELSINLMKHQRMGLNWLKRMEESKSKGGILADDMGLGKTIQAIALILSNKSKDSDYKTTLIIAPVSLLRQWAAEIESKLKPSCALKIGIYHGGEKRSLAKFEDIETYDVLLTSYGTLSSEWKRHFREAILSFKSGEKESIATFMPRFEDGGKSYKSPFFCKESTFHRVILDEAQNIKNKTSLASKSVTYLKSEFRLCLSGTPIQNNVDELYPILRFLKIRPYDNEFKFRSDISVPLRSNSEHYDDFEKGKSIKKLRALLKAILLRRVKDSLIDGKPILSLPQKHVLSDYVDMNETEKEYYTSLESGIQKKAKRLLNSKSRHSATGILTLLLRLRQACCHWFLVEIGEIKAAKNKKADDDLNNPKDWRKMYAQVVSLDVEVVDRIKALDESSNKITEDDDQDNAGIELEVDHEDKENLEGPSTKNKLEVMVPRLENTSEIRGFGVANEIIQPKVEIIDDDIEVIEEVTYTNNTKNENSSRNLIKDSENILDQITSLQDQSEDAEQRLQRDEDMLTCPICFNVLTPSESITILPRCGHMICHSCIDIFFENHSTDDESGKFAKCVECQNKVHQGDLIDYEIFRKVHNEGYGYGAIGEFCKKYYAPSGVPRNNVLIQELIAEEKGFNVSAKIAKALGLLKEIFEKSPDEKVIIFSQFTVLFDVFKIALDESGIDFLRYDGSMSLDAKNTTIKRFYQEDIKVLLLSLKAGNTGLTLTCASRVIIMDPFWNPFVEEQAMDRAYRIGQEREVYVHRILISGTVESRIMELQDRKKELVQSALDEKGMKSVSRLGQQELGFLFGLNGLPG